MEVLYKKVQAKEDVRESLIEIRKLLKENNGLMRLQNAMDDGGEMLAELLSHEDPKVRKNAALILGELKEPRFLQQLFSSYEQEQTMFVRSSYLKAMEGMDCTLYLDDFARRLSELNQEDGSKENEKHIREETAALNKMLLKRRKEENHRFFAYDEPMDVILTTNRIHREVTAKQVTEGKITLMPGGVRVRQGRISQLQNIRTYRELLLPIPIKEPLSGDPEEAGAQLAAFGLPEFLQKLHKGQGPFYIRISIGGRMTLEKRGTFIKTCGYRLERLTGGKLVATPSGYEAELRLMERQEGGFVPVVKLFTWKDGRFSYRKESVSASIQPSAAALTAALAKPYLKEDAQVLDPFCGVGTMLIERDAAVKAKTMYGIDIFGEAIEKAKGNTLAAGLKIYYIHRDFFDFTHEYLFDEIFTNMPVRGRKTKEEQDMMYGRFFEKAAKFLKKDGIIVMYSNEKGFVKKHLRLNSRFVLLKEHCLQEKENVYLFIIGQRGHALL